MAPSAFIGGSPVGYHRGRTDLYALRSETGLLLRKCILGIPRDEERKGERVGQVLKVYQRQNQGVSGVL